jgi:UDP-N-acetylmuramoyl-L-alanyl-D-glutamate--2,6-diaminopimelate ligase
MQLKQLIKEMPVLRVEGSLDRDIVGIVYDSRRVTPGMVFVAIPGVHADGHDFINTAIDRGAAAIICEKNGFSSPRATKIKVPDAREALARAAASYYQHPSTKLQVIGVTGTNGKTTVAFMVKEILEAAGIKTGLLGTVRYEIGERVIPASRTTPESLEVHQMMAQMLANGCKACVMEVSSHALEQKRVAGIEFDVQIFTNLTQDHLDFHGTMENYFIAKQKLFTRSANGSKKGAVVINIDDASGVRLAAQTDVTVKLTYGIRSVASIRATKVDLAADVSRFTIEMPDKNFACKLPLIGRHNIYNALAATGASVAIGIEPAKIQSALNKMQPVPGRLESVASGQPFAVLVDYAHTDDALHNVLTTLREVTSGRLFLLFGCGGNRDAGKRPKMGRVAAEFADFTIITSDNPRKEKAEAIAAQIEEGFRSVRQGDYRVELDRQRAITEILAMAKAGDTVLLAGKGHETYQEFEDTVVPFDDRIHAREALENMGFKGGRR